MIDLTKNEAYLRAVEAEKLLTDALVWFDTFNTQDKLSKLILGWIKKDQLFDKGVDSNDKNIGFYSFVTEVISGGRKEQGDHYTLDDTGEFKQTMVVIVLSNALVIKADTEKMEDQAWWRDEILGLTDENMQKLRDEYRENVINYGKRVLAGRV